MRVFQAKKRQSIPRKKGEWAMGGTGAASAANVCEE